MSLSNVSCLPNAQPLRLGDSGLCVTGATNDYGRRFALPRKGQSRLPILPGLRNERYNRPQAWLAKHGVGPPKPRLIREAQKGSRTAFEALVRQYDQPVLRLALRLTGSEQDAQDIHQEAFLKAYRYLANFRFENVLFIPGSTASSPTCASITCGGASPAVKSNRWWSTPAAERWTC